ncbi:hypothetical protein FDECE_12488 [Fusarium decemcellulare]|nr:hypothetical protein FDECE_12488 [Fusarium decemcellulare]
MGVSKFKVILVGGGPSGLTAAHALHLAGIDFVLLERRENIVEDVGASLVLGPPSLRIMHQFGILDELFAIGREVEIAKSFDLQGRQFKNSTKVQLLRQNFGSGPVAFHRAQLIQVLYDRLPSTAKENIHLGKKLAGIESSENGVTVSCADGSVYEGSLVIGADGVHSKTRKMMRKLALEDNPTQDWEPEEPFVSSYKCMWASFQKPGKEGGQNYDTQHQNKSVMYISGRARSWIFLYEKLPEPTSARASYSEKDMEAFAEGFQDFPITETLKVKDLWDKRLQPGMANLEEGVADHWSWNRIVLVGDACHKFTPNAGLGLNNGIQDVVMLCNSLQKTVSAGDTSQRVLNEIFHEYQKVRKEKLQSDASRSAGMTRMQAWENTKYYLLSRYVMSSPLVEHLLIEFLASRGMREAPVLDYVPCEEPLKGKVAWTHAMPSVKSG